MTNNSNNKKTPPRSGGVLKTRATNTPPGSVESIPVSDAAKCVEREANGSGGTPVIYTFKNPELFERAMTHSSYANERRIQGGSNERFEFLGDSVLSLVTSEYLFKTFSHLPEGELTKMRAGLVCERSLCRFAQDLDLGEQLLLGKGERSTGGAERPSILADAFEALIAAVYIDGGLAGVRKFLIPLLKKELSGKGSNVLRDYKTTLQEIIQKNPEEKLLYIQTGESGPDHSKLFDVEVRLNSNVIGRGRGRSKKEAEQLAAKEALELMGE